MLAKILDQSSLDNQRLHGVAHQDIKHNQLRVKVLDAVDIDQILEFVLSGAEWKANDKIVRETAQFLRENRHHLKSLGVSLTCAQQATDNAYFGSLLLFLGLKTIRRQTTINGKRISIYRLDKTDLERARIDLLMRYDRHLEAHKGLELTAQSDWVHILYGTHTPNVTIEFSGYVQDLAKFREILGKAEQLPPALKPKELKLSG